MEKYKKCTCGHDDFKLILEIAISNTKITEDGNVENMKLSGNPVPSRVICLNCNKEYKYNEFIKAKCECCGNLFNHSDMVNNLCSNCNAVVEMVKKSPIEIARQIINQQGSANKNNGKSDINRKEENKVENTKKNEEQVQDKQKKEAKQKTNKSSKTSSKREEKVVKKETFSDVTINENGKKVLDLTSNSIFSDNEEEILKDKNIEECDFMEQVENEEFNNIAEDLFNSNDDDDFDFDNFDSYN